MAKTKKIKAEKRKIPKVVELVSVLASYLDSEMEYGESMNMTPLAKEIDLNGSSPHVDTVRNKLTEAFIFKDVLKDFNPIYEEGKLVRIDKIEPKEEINMERILNILTKILSENHTDLKKDLADLKKEISEVKKSEDKK
jgi:hypothetical protein